MPYSLNITKSSYSNVTVVLMSRLFVCLLVFIEIFNLFNSTVILKRRIKLFYEYALTILLPDGFYSLFGVIHWTEYFLFTISQYGTFRGWT